MPRGRGSASSRRETRPTTSAKTPSARDRRKASDAQKHDRARRKALKERIADRLASVPASWVAAYEAKLARAGIDPHARVAHVHHLPTLEDRARLLPPATVYRQHVHKRHPSRPEPRAVKCESMEGHTKDYVASRCNNTRIIRDTFMTPLGSPVRRFSPKNVRRVTFADGGNACVHPHHVRTLNRNGFMVGADYQKDADTDEWPEVRVDVPNASGEILQARLPYHVVGKCGVRLKAQPPGNRKNHPTHPENEFLEDA